MTSVANPAGQMAIQRGVDQLKNVKARCDAAKPGRSDKPECAAISHQSRDVASKERWNGRYMDRDAALAGRQC